ncbi:RNA polymerase sigma-70 factor [Fulvivirgaceae bacterium BMA10]|uniref:RNA polymerase sigma-70 factor n=1 Tax=Splendidivirga corallicola TaxID=3051826 RepID=A0ABT8KLS2_9BACT|nr:RNA polymerase sigma-70 factor [Fulvivirgaceae bacterium BMA10]
MAQFNDIKVLRGLRRGSLNAFNEIYEQYAVKLFNFSMLYLKSREEAEEIVQDVFVKIWQNREKINEELSFNGYIFRIAKNCVLNKLRKKINEPDSFVSVNQCLVGQNQTENEVLFRDMEGLLEEAIEGLPVQRQLIFRMSRQNGLSNKEIAEQLDISVNTVEGQIRKAINYLRNYIDILPIIIATLTL